MEEIWKDIPEYKGLYQASNLGKIRRITKSGVNKIIKSSINRGYLRVCLCKNNIKKNIFVHRAVLMSFVGNSDLQVDHIDGNKLNNKLENLEYVTCKENIIRAFKKELQKSVKSKNIEAWKKGINTHKKIYSKKTIQKDFKGNTLKIFLSVSEASKQTGIPSGNIAKCCNKRYGYKTAGGYIWEYIKE